MLGSFAAASNISAALQHIETQVLRCFIFCNQGHISLQSIHNVHPIEHKYKIGELYIRHKVIKNVVMWTDIGYYSATGGAVFYAITSPQASAHLTPATATDIATLSLLYCIIVYGLKIKFWFIGLVSAITRSRRNYTTRRRADSFGPSHGKCLAYDFPKNRERFGKADRTPNLGVRNVFGGVAVGSSCSKKAKSILKYSSRCPAGFIMYGSPDLSYFVTLKSRKLDSQKVKAKEWVILTCQGWYINKKDDGTLLCLDS